MMKNTLLLKINALKRFPLKQFAENFATQMILEKNLNNSVRLCHTLIYLTIITIIKPDFQFYFFNSQFRLTRSNEISLKILNGNVLDL